MKNIFRIAFCCIFLSSIFQLQAQTYRIEAGYLQPVRYSDKVSNRYFNGIRLGGTVDFQLPLDFMTIHTGLLYSFTFSNDTQKFLGTDSIVFKTQGHYLDIPLHITASYNLFKQIKVFAFAGPNFNIGLYQPQKVNSNLTDGATIEWLNQMNIKQEDSNLYSGDLRWFNFQLEAGGGIQWRKFIIKGGYSFGINDLSKKDIDKQRLSGWSVSAAYEF